MIFTSKHSRVLALLPLFLAGCRDNDITTYEVPKETRQMAMPAASTGSPSTDLVWDEPATWQAKPLTAFRKGSFSAGADENDQVDISVSVFPDQAGGLLANVNRWRGQIGLEPTDDETLAQETTEVMVAGVPGVRLDMIGPADSTGVNQRIVGVVASIDGSAWFFKMIGSQQAVASEMGTFDDFVETVHARSPSPPPGLPGANMASQADAVPTPPAPAPFSFDAPPNWNRQPPSPLRVASFLIPGDGVPDADLSVVALPGPAGGDLANVNRWRGQIGLDPITESELSAGATHLHSGPFHIDVYEMVSEGPVLEDGNRARILVAILKEGQTSWFFKLTGEDELVAGEKAAFIDFLMSFQLEEPS